MKASTRLSEWITEVLKFGSRKRQNSLLSSKTFRLGLDATKPSIQRVNGAFSFGVKRPGREAN
jgi:hypothetical protein